MVFSAILAATTVATAAGGTIQDPRIDTLIAIPVEQSIELRAGAQDPAIADALRAREQSLTLIRDAKSDLKDALTLSFQATKEANRDQSITNLVTTDDMIAFEDAFAVQKDTSKKVSVRFEHAQASEVFRWLQKQDVSFIVDESKIDEKARVTLSANNVSLNALTDALANALGGHWVNRKGMRVFQKGALNSFFSTPAIPGGYRTYTMPEFKTRVMQVPRIDTKPLVIPKFDKTFELQMKEGEKERAKMLRDLAQNQRQWKSLDFGKSDWKGLMKSLTQEQQQKHEKQGFLKYSDLTDAQKRMLGTTYDGKGEFELKIQMDDKSLVIKGN